MEYPEEQARQVSLTAVGAYRPTVQISQLVWLNMKVPLGQMLHRRRSAVLNLPLWHVVQSSALSCSALSVPRSVLIFPLLHRSHDLEPGPTAILPALHMVHVSDAFSEADVPTRQSSQATEPSSSAYFPGEQASHPRPWAVVRLE